MFKNRKFLFWVIGIITFLGAVAYNNSLTKENDTKLLTTARNFLSEDYKEVQGNYAASTWGNYVEAGNTLKRVSFDNETATQVNELKQVIEDRKQGDTLTKLENLINQNVDKSIDKLKDQVQQLKAIPDSSRHSAKAIELSNALTAMIDDIALKEARKYLDQGNLKVHISHP